MRILVNEFVKVFNKKPIILIFIGLLILNGVLLYINDKDDLEKNNIFFKNIIHYKILMDLPTKH